MRRPGLGTERRSRSRTRGIRLAALIGADLCAFALAVASAHLLGSVIRAVAFGEGAYIDAGGIHSLLIVFGPALAVLLWRSWEEGHYTRFRPLWTELHGVLKSAAVIVALTTFTLFALRSHFSRLWFACFLVELVLLVPWFRRVARDVLIRQGAWFRPTWIVGTGEDARRLVAPIESDIALGHRVVGFVDLSAVGRREGSRPDEAHPQPVVARMLDGLPVRDALPEAVTNDRGELALVFALGSLAELERHRATLDAHIATNAAVSVAPPASGLPLYGAEMTDIFRHDTTLLRLKNDLANPRARLLKRGVDLVVSATALALIALPSLVLGLAIVRDGGPVLFRHRRLGQGGTSFDCLKFRTMRVDAEAVLARHLAENSAARLEWRETHKLRDDPRLTRPGRWLRRNSLDELPQLWNVLHGDMSLVGPRPIVSEERPFYGDLFEYYLGTRPGLTGLWQVSGRSDTTYAHRVELDVWYTRNWSLWNDFVILVQTVPALIGRQGAY